MKFNRLKVFRKLQIIIALILACSFVSSCSAPGLKTAGEKPLYHVYLTFDDGPLEGSEDVDNAVRAEKVKINVFVVGSYIQIFPPMGNIFSFMKIIPISKYVITASAMLIVNMHCFIKILSLLIKTS